VSREASQPNTAERQKRGDNDLWAVFRAQEDAGELLVYRASFLIAGAGLCLPALSSLLSGDGLRNVPFFVLASIYFLWFGVAVLLKKRNVAPTFVRWASVVTWASIPWTVMGAYVNILGILRAIGVWEPIVLFTAICVLSVVWARPAVPVVIATIGASAYLGLWFVTTPPSTWATLPPDGPLVPHITVYRAMLLLFIGGLSWWGARKFRGAVLSGARALRQRDLFGKYRLQDRLGVGGMGSVVKATYCPEGGFERPVAIKRVLEHIASQPEVVERFRAEAELGSRLVHPNIVAVLDFGRVDREYFFAMEYVDGPSLQQVLSRARKADKPLPTDFIARVGTDLCAALLFAHEEAVDTEGRALRVVHRDLCPANILLSRAGTVKLTDFGIARVLGDAEVEQTSTVIGKIAYMAPELLIREAFDPRADIFSLGVILWEMLAGERFSRRNEQGAAALVVARHPAPLPSLLRKGIPRGWDEVVTRCLKPEAEDRYASVRELREDLLELLADEETADGHEVQRFLESFERSSGREWRGIEEEGLESDSAPGHALSREQATALLTGHTQVETGETRTGEAIDATASWEPPPGSVKP
jgi:serine/threonine-protein kinase